MTHLLDTNIVSALLQRETAVLLRLRTLNSTGVAISVIVQHELLFGALRSTRTADMLKAIGALQFHHLDFTFDDARQAAEIRSELASIGRLIGPYDILIAAQARARDLTLVTRNTREFERVQGLRVEAW